MKKVLYVRSVLVRTTTIGNKTASNMSVNPVVLEQHYEAEQ